MSEPHGRHLAFPFSIGTDGRSKQVQSLEEHVRGELLQLLLTNEGERPFLPAFGGGVRRLVFEPASEATRGMAKAQITEALSEWLGHRVSLEDLIVEAEEATVQVTIRYRIAGTEKTRVMRFERSEV